MTRVAHAWSAPHDPTLSASSSPTSSSLLTCTTQTGIEEVYRFGEKLGRGGFGYVIKAESRRSGLHVAIKSISKSRERDWGASRIKQEIAILRKLEHPHVIALQDVFEDVRFVYLVMELCRGGSLAEWWRVWRRLDEGTTMVLMHQVLSAIQYLHQKKICHRDVKHANLMFLHEGSLTTNMIKLADFGLACRYSTAIPLREPVGTVQFAAPQVLEECYNHMCDLWSCGVVLFSLLCGFLPFRCQDVAAMRRAVRRGLVQECWEGPKKSNAWESVSATAVDLVQQLMSWDPARRCTAEQALGHECFADIQRIESETQGPSVDADEGEGAHVDEDGPCVVEHIGVQFPDWPPITCPVFVPKAKGTNTEALARAPGDTRCQPEEDMSPPMIPRSVQMTPRCTPATSVLGLNPVPLVTEEGKSQTPPRFSTRMSRKCYYT